MSDRQNDVLAAIDAAVDRAADGMTSPEWTWFCHAFLTTAVGIVATPVLALAAIAGNQLVFGATVGTTAGCVLVSLTQHAWYAYRVRGCTPIGYDQPWSTT